MKFTNSLVVVFALFTGFAAAMPNGGDNFHSGSKDMQNGHEHSQVKDETVRPIEYLSCIANYLTSLLLQMHDIGREDTKGATINQVCATPSTTPVNSCLYPDQRFGC